MGGKCLIDIRGQRSKAYFVDLLCTKTAQTESGLLNFSEMLMSCFYLPCSGPPSWDAWLERQNGTLVAVCKVSSVKHAANISWNHEGVLVNTQAESDGKFIVESRLELLKETDTETLECTIRHPDWPEGLKLKPTFGENKKGVQNMA